MCNNKGCVMSFKPSLFNQDTPGTVSASILIILIALVVGVIVYFEIILKSNSHQVTYISIKVDSEEFKRLSQLRDEDPNKFRQELRKVWSKKEKSQNKDSERSDKKDSKESLSDKYNRFRKVLEQAQKKNPSEFKRLQKLYERYGKRWTY